MSDDKTNDGSAVDLKVSKPDDTKEVVSKKAYEEVSRDMHKNKQKAKELELALNELQTQLKVQEETKMQEKEEWKELYEREKAKAEEERQKLEQEKGRYTRSVKISALKQELGGNVKDEYLGFAKLDSIVIDESGSIDADSLLSVANQYRKEHGQLISTSDGTNITGHSASNLDNFNPKSASEMTPKERVDALTEIYANKK